MIEITIDPYVAVERGCTYDHLINHSAIFVHKMCFKLVVLIIRLIIYRQVFGIHRQ